MGIILREKKVIKPLIILTATSKVGFTILKKDLIRTELQENGDYFSWQNLIKMLIILTAFEGPISS